MLQPAPARSTVSTPRILLTGFDAFGGETLNPSWLAVQQLHDRRVAGHKIVAAQLPTVFDQSLLVLRGLLKLYQPSLVICVGQAAGRSALSLERVAININDARIADNAAAQPIDTPVVPGGPSAYFTSLPVKAMLLALHRENFAAEVSQSAGTFVCNHVFYGLMHMLATQRGLKRTRGGFIHVPLMDGQGTPCMALDEIVRGLRIAVRSALSTSVDIRVTAGAVS